MTDYPTGSPAAGWYTDPADTSQERWWGGAQWTHDTRPIAAPVVAAPAFADVPGGGVNPFAALDAQQSAPTSEFGSDAPSFSRGANDFSDFNSLGASGFGSPETRYDVSASWYDNDRRPSYSAPPTNGQATAGLVLSLLGFNLFGIIFSVIGLRKAREFEQDGDLPVGRKRSRWGLGLGIASAVIGIILTVVLLLFWQSIYSWALQQQGTTVTTTDGFTVDDDAVTPFDSADAIYDRAAYEQEIADEYAWEEMGTPISITCPDVASTSPGSQIVCTIVLSDRVDRWTADYAEDGMYMVTTETIQ